MDKDFFGNVWIKANKDVREYPIGTKFKALMGGYWIKLERGFKWCNGSTFPNVGGDWTGEVCIPECSDFIAETRECGNCKHFKLDTGANVLGTCSKKLMTVTSSMFINYKKEDGTCFE
jgi:hypothetical protein